VLRLNVHHRVIGNECDRDSSDLQFIGWRRGCALGLVRVYAIGTAFCGMDLINQLGVALAGC
jgi:hypothetical protein